ncbi:thyroid adenoma-associated protein homolog isoform X2 [Tripterygium wilfordii]|nr:thyroid adenoma-associated protein homolog isoform X2 [Tripterygium wilfordii]
MGTRILKIIWNNLEDPLSQTVKQVHLIFDLFLDIQSSLQWAEGNEQLKTFLRQIASDLLHLGPRCKGRYVPLASLTKRLGAKTIMDMNPDLLYETVQAYADDDVCCAATSFLKCFLECLRGEYWNSDGIESGYTRFRGHCLPPILLGLASGVSKLRSNLNIYALPVLLEVDVDGIFPMLAFISVGPSGEENGLLYPELGCANMDLSVEQQVAVFVSLLKVSRSLALIEGDLDLCKDSTVLLNKDLPEKGHINVHALVWVKGVRIKVLVEWLELALTHVDESVRVDAAESIFLNPKTASLPSHLELSLIKKAVPLNMRSSSTGFQMKWTSLFRKFFSRVRAALERQFKQGIWQPLVHCDNDGLSLHMTNEENIDRAEFLFNFMRWMTSFLYFSCYPSAPYKRKIMAMELILIVLSVWSIIPSSQEKHHSNSLEGCLSPYSKGITSPDSTLLLVGSIIDSWDRLRESSFRILLHFPTPLPGIASEDMVQKVIAWAKILVCSPRVRESDAGALTLRLLFRKYVVELGWTVRASGNAVCFHSESKLVNADYQNCESSSSVMEYVKSLIDWLNAVVEEGERDLSQACRNSFVHGVLLTLRYTFEELDWNSNAILSSISEMRRALEKFLELVMRITSLALWVVSADALYLPEDMDEMVEDDSFLLEVAGEVDLATPSSEQESKISTNINGAQPSQQIVMVGCWLAMKEVSLLLGTIMRKIPLPSDRCEDSLELGSFCDAEDASVMSVPDAVLDFRQLGKIGNHFLEVLLKMKHNGAIDKTRAGFTALCNRLLCSNDPRLCKLTESWMEQLMERTVAKGQVVDDLLRRSAGIPAAFTALFLSEPECSPKKLLPRALRWLIDVASSRLPDPVETNSGKIDLSGSLLMESMPEPESSMSLEVNLISKTRNEGVIPTVHSFNVLRAVFNDTNLATDTSGFSAEALIVSIRSFSSPYWEVRNSACLAYTALVRRMIGFLNVHKRESARRALTGLEFFHRYPSLHPFLFNELKVATELLGDSSSQRAQSNLAKVVHPSLCPVLILLSRLKPSPIASQTGDTLDPFLFMPFIKSCSTQSNLRIRVLASRALTCLVSNEKLPIVLRNLASEFPCFQNQITGASVSSFESPPRIGTSHTSFNLVHGLLLQLCSLLDVNCRNLADSVKRDQILGDLIQVLGSCSWIARPRLCPCPILNTSFLRMLDHMLSISRSNHKSNNFNVIRILLLELSSECLEVEGSYGLSYYDPTIAELREQGAISYFSCIFQASKEVCEGFLQIPLRPILSDTGVSKIPEEEFTSEELEERLIFCLSDSSYEVRLATLKWLLRFLRSTGCGDEVWSLCVSKIRIIKRWTRTNLQATLMKLLDLEKNHRCQCYILRILFTWNQLQFQNQTDEMCTEIIYVGTMDFNAVFQFWDKLISLYKCTRHAKTRETLICCMAICVKRYTSTFTSFILANGDMQKTVKYSESNEAERSSHLFECITFFVNLIKEHSSSSEPVSMRQAAAESIVASGFLEQAEPIGSSVFNVQIQSENLHSDYKPQVALNLYAHQVLEIWFTCIKLLEDEDDEIRQRLAMDSQKCFSSKRSGRNHIRDSPAQVEKVIELSFEYLSSIFGHWIDYFDYLAQWVMNVANVYVASHGDLVRRVFDKEIDNHHEEKLLISQICCSHMEKLPILNSYAADLSKKHWFRDYLHGWRKKFSHQLISFAKDYVEKLGQVDWIGGVGNHKDAFLPLYANLLCFYALSKCIFNGEFEDGMSLDSLLSDVVELGETITPFLRNPLISNLYVLVVKLHETKLSAIAEHSIPKFIDDDSVWDGFDPYFLLR